MGIERKFLRFAEPECISDPQEQYGIHNFKTITIKNVYGDELCVPHDEQFQNALTLLDSGHLWSIPAGLIVINAPYHFFDGDGTDRGPEGFLAHLICSLASRMERRKARPVTVNFLGTMQLNHPYDLKERHLLVWGPLTEHSGQYDFTKTIQFMYDFRGHTKILLTCSKDLSALLTNLKINTKQITYLFNLGAFIDEPDDKKKNRKPTEKTPRKSKAKVKFEAL